MYKSIEEQIKEKEIEKLEIEKKRMEDLKVILELPQGRRVLFDIIYRRCVFNCPSKIACG